MTLVVRREVMPKLFITSSSKYKKKQGEKAALRKYGILNSVCSGDTGMIIEIQAGKLGLRKKNKT